MPTLGGLVMDSIQDPCSWTHDYKTTLCRHVTEKMKSIKRHLYIKGLVLVSTLSMIGCGIIQQVIQPTPDRVATGVAESRAIAGTLTAEPASATLTLLPTMTVMQIASTPTSTRVFPTSTSISTLISPSMTPTLSLYPDTAVIMGKLVYGETDEPLEQGKLVRLVQVETVEGETILIFGGVDDPMAETQSDGSFMINNVQPGRYAIVVHNVRGALYVQLESSVGNLIIISFETGGQEIDLGTIPVHVKED